MSGNHFTAKDAIDAKSQYSNFLHSAVNKNFVTFQNYNIDEKRLDNFLMSYLENSSRFPQLIEVFKSVMVLSRGQSAAERGFNVY